jgi:D-3-phosphoglycerate dehydrogenase
LAPKRNDRIEITYGGKAQEWPTDPITRSVLKGFLEMAGGKEVNQVNVRSLATSLGLEIQEIKSSEATDFNEWLHVAVFSGEERISAGGSVFGAKCFPRIVRLSGHPVEIVPEGVLLLMNNKDRPGIVGYLGTLLGKHHVNIANMSLGRDKAGGRALTILNLDSVPPPQLLEEIQKDPDISNVRVVKF